MLRNISIAIFSLILIGSGIGYAIFQDPDRLLQNLVKESIHQVATKAKQLEPNYLKSGSLKKGSFSLSLDYKDSQGQSATLPVQVNISGQMISLRYGDGDIPVANQTLILKPVAKNQSVIWQCLDGSLLIRLRPKDCRLGYGIRLADY